MGNLTAAAIPPAWRQRLLVYGLAGVLCQALILAGSAWRQRWLVDADGNPIASDFLAWWSAGRLALAGRAVDAYDMALHKAAQLAAVGHDFDGFFLWLNPPHFFLIVTPFALPPYVEGWVLWVIVTAAFCAAMLRLVVPGCLVAALMAAPATLWCATPGQNGFVSAGLMAGALALLPGRPVAAGVLIGLLTYKPQFGLLFPLFLLLDQRWAAIAAATVTSLGLAALSLLLYGADAWLAFLGSLGDSHRMLLVGGAGWSKLQSLFAILAQATGSPELAMAAQLGLVAALAALLGWLRWRGAPHAPRAAVLILAAHLATPYVYIYDAVLLTAAAAFLLRDGLERGFARFDIALIVLGLALPGLLLLLGSFSAPAGLLVLLAVALRRCRPGLRPRPG